MGRDRAVPALRPLPRGAKMRYPPTAFAVASYWRARRRRRCRVALRGLVDVGDCDAGQIGGHAADVAVLGGDGAHQRAERDIVPGPPFGGLEARAAAVARIVSRLGTSDSSDSSW